MKSGCIEHPARERMIVMRQWQIDACDGDKCAALLLSFLEYWHNIKLGMVEQNKFANDISEEAGEGRTQDEQLYQYHSEQMFVDGIMGLYAKDKIASALRLLKEKGFITIHRNPSPRYKFDRTRHILFHSDAVNEYLQLRTSAKNRSRSAENRSPSSENPSSSAENRLPSPENRSTIPKTSTETTTETSTKTSTEQEYTPRPARGSDAEYSSDYIAFYESYPRQIAKKAGWVAWQARLHDDKHPVTAAELQAAAKNYAEVCRISGQYAMYPSTFLGPNLRYADYLDPSCIKEAKKIAEANRRRNQGYSYYTGADTERTAEDDDFWERIAKR